MASTRFTLYERQLSLLRRIVTGDSPVTSAEPELATTVYALRNRGLVEARRRHGNWTATPTDAGRFFVEIGWHPDDPRRRTSAPARAPAPPRPPRPPVTATTAESRRPTPRATLPEPPTSESVPVPLRLTRPHAVVAATRSAMRGLPLDDSGRLRVRRAAAVELRVSRPALPRTLRLLQALFAESERRGHTVVTTSRPGVSVRCRDHDYAVSVVEEVDRKPHIPTATELRRRERYSWERPPDYDYTPNGRLRIELPAFYRRDSTGRRRSWRDTSRQRLEDALHLVLAEIEARADVDEAARLEREERQRERELAEWRARDDARAAFLRDARRAAIREQVEQWHLAQRIRASARVT